MHFVAYLDAHPLYVDALALDTEGEDASIVCGTMAAAADHVVRWMQDGLKLKASAKNQFRWPANPH